VTTFLNEQINTQRIFDQLHLMADGRMRQTQFVGGVTDALAPGGGLETLQRLKRRQPLKIDFLLHNTTLTSNGAIV
jgi:hypothetical protein